MRASPIDPRDQTSQIDDPIYRACFWTGSDNSGDWSCDEWELAEADLDEVLDWVKANGNGRLHSLWAVLPAEEGVQLVRLSGVDPASAASGRPRWAKTAKS